MAEANQTSNTPEINEAPKKPRGRPKGSTKTEKSNAPLINTPTNGSRGRPRRVQITPELIEEMLATITTQSDIINGLKQELNVLRESNLELKTFIERGVERAMDDHVRGLLTECRNGLANMTNLEKRLMQNEQTINQLVGVVNGEFYVSPNRYQHEIKDSFV